ncbi:MAG: PorT family protein [Chitinophagaceae bacterium]|jgi:hypothetical protein|nr:PorT family protein [Chitinophagaceae bacterium]
MKTILMASALLACSLAGYAQADQQLANSLKKDQPNKKDLKKNGSGILFAQVGPQMSWPGGDGGNYSGGALGIGGGVEGSLLQLNKRMLLQGGLLFSQQGGKTMTYSYNPGVSYGEVETTRRLNYLAMPVTALYQTRPRQGFFAEAGLQPALLLSAKEEGRDLKDEYKPFDLGLVAGVGYQFGRHIRTQLRVVPGLLNIRKESTYNLSERNLVASLRVGYVF